MADPKLASNPLPGDENMEVCIVRQTNRKVPRSIAEQVCLTLSTVLGANALKEADAILVPAVFTAEGVHNGRLKPWAAIKNAAPTLMGVPFFINQPGEHEDGQTPPVDDPTVHHGFVAQVNVDHEARHLTGLIGLYTPEYLRAKGFTEARVNFQQKLIEAVQKGGRFAISTSFLARVRRVSGFFGNKAYSGVEERLVFNGLSLVPLGAEATALMNGFSPDGRGTKESEVEVIEQGFNAATDASNQPDSIEDSNTQRGQSGPTDMDDAALRSMSITALSGLNPEVARVANALTQAEKDLAVANKRADGLDVQIKALQKDAEDTQSVLANVLAKDAAQADEILANAETSAPLARRVQTAVRALANDLGEVRKVKNEAAQKRIEKAKLALANHMKAEALKDYEDPSDLEKTANRLEGLVKLRSVQRVRPSGEILSNADRADAGAETGDSDLERWVNAESDPFQGLLDLYSLPGANKAAGKTAPTTEVDA